MKARKVSETPKRGFHAQVLREPGWSKDVYVKNGYTLVPCTGEAHSNPHIDNCLSCLSGVWGWRLTEGSDPTPVKP